MEKERSVKAVDSRRISKLLSLMLRHRPDEFGLDMDEYGYIPLDEVVEAIQQRYSEVTEENVTDLVDQSNPQRFEIVEDYIRALYGHSFYLEIDDEPIDPPEKLFMGTTSKEAALMPEEGLRPVDRFYIHLSLTREVAESRSHQVGEPCVVEIFSKRAFEEGGVEFYERGEVVLSKAIPAEFVGEISGLNAVANSDGDGANVRHEARPNRRQGKTGVRPQRSSERRDEKSDFSVKVVSEQPSPSFGRKPRRDAGRR